MLPFNKLLIKGNITTDKQKQKDMEASGKRKKTQLTAQRAIGFRLLT